MPPPKGSPAGLPDQSSGKISVTSSFSSASAAVLAVSGGALWARAGSGIAVSAMLSARTMLMSRFCIRSSPFQSPFQAGRFLLYPVYHVLPALDGFGHESPRKCAETTRCTTRTRKNRKPPGLRLPDGFLLYRNYGNGILNRALLCACSIPRTAAKVVHFCVNGP